MPKVGQTKPKGELVNATPLPKYATAPWPESVRGDERYALLNLQTCTCDHDRCVHSDTVGEGEARRVILDAPHVGTCRVKGCKCVGFIFSQRSSVEGKKRRSVEKAKYKVIPPGAK